MVKESFSPVNKCLDYIIPVLYFNIVPSTDRIELSFKLHSPLTCEGALNIVYRIRLIKVPSICLMG